MTTKERLKEFLSLKKVGRNKFEEALGIASGYMSSKGVSINSDVIEKSLEYFPDLNPIWLLTGEGEMLRSRTNITGDNNQAFTGTSGIAIGIGRDNTGKINVSEGQHRRKSNNTGDDAAKVNFTTGVPYFNVDFIGGFDLVMNDQTVNPEYLIDFRKYNDADCWCNVTGHSMEPEISQGDIIALKEVKDMSFLPIGEVYAIVTTNEMRTIKRLGVGDDNDHYNLIPTNKSTEYGIQPIPKNMILKIFQVLGSMKRL